MTAHVRANRAGLTILGVSAILALALFADGCGDDSASVTPSADAGGTDASVSDVASKDSEGGAGKGGTAGAGAGGKGGSSIGGSGGTAGASTGGSAGDPDAGGSAGAAGSTGGTLTCGPTFSATVTPGQDFSLDTSKSGEQMNSNKKSSMDSSSCGDLGVVYRDSAGGAAYRRFTKDGLQEQSSVVTTGVWDAPSLFYDSNCVPHVLLPSAGATDYTPDGQGGWKATPVALTPLTGYTASGIYGVVHGRDGKVHLLLRGLESGSSERVLHGIYQGNGAWNFVSLPSLTFTNEHTCFMWTSNQVFNFAVDSKGEVHAALSNDCELGYAVTSAGAWQQEVVVPMADDRDIPGWDGFLAIDAKDQPAIANGHSTHYSGWSIKSLTFNYLTRTGGAWTSELIANKSDSYEGTDGPQYAGAEVQLYFDGYGQPYVTFNDLASWHITYNYTAVGQIRYAIKACDKWFFKTLFQQEGQKVSPNPIQECLHPMMTLGQDGQTMLFACAQRSIADEKGSNNNQGGGWPATLRAFLASQLLQ